MACAITTPSSFCVANRRLCSCADRGCHCVFNQQGRQPEPAQLNGGSATPIAIDAETVNTWHRLGSVDMLGHITHTCEHGLDNIGPYGPTPSLDGELCRWLYIDCFKNAHHYHCYPSNLSKTCFCHSKSCLKSSLSRSSSLHAQFCINDVQGYNLVQILPNCMLDKLLLFAIQIIYLTEISTTPDSTVAIILADSSKCIYRGFPPLDASPCKKRF